MRYKGGVISATPPTVTPPVGGEGGSASGIWSLKIQGQYEGTGEWPKPVLPRELYAWGLNNSGNLAQGNTVNTSSPVQVGSDTTWNTVDAGANIGIATKTDGTLWAWGNNFHGQLGQNVQNISASSPVQVGALTTWQSAIVGLNNWYAVKSDGTAWVCGQNSYGTLGINDAVNRSSPVQLGASNDWYLFAGSQGATTCFAIKTDGTLWSWGRNSSGNLGQNDTINRSSPTQIGSLTTWQHVSSAFDGGFAVKTDGTLWAWGAGALGVLGQNNEVYRSSPIQVGALSNWATTSGANFSAMAVKTDGTLWSWGQNNWGQLGHNDRINRSSPVQVGASSDWGISSGGEYEFASTKTDGTIWSWGQNSSGVLGLNDTANRSSPTQIGSDTNWDSISISNATLALAKG